MSQTGSLWLALRVAARKNLKSAISQGVLIVTHNAKKKSRPAPLCSLPIMTSILSEFALESASCHEHDRIQHCLAVPNFYKDGVTTIVKTRITFHPSPQSKPVHLRPQFKAAKTFRILAAVEVCAI